MKAQHVKTTLAQVAKERAKEIVISFLATFAVAYALQFAGVILYNVAHNLATLQDVTISTLGNVALVSAIIAAAVSFCLFALVFFQEYDGVLFHAYQSEKIAWDEKENDKQRESVARWTFDYYAKPYYLDFKAWKRYNA